MNSGILSVLIITVTIVVATCLFILIIDVGSRSLRRKDVLAMNREIANYDIPGWVVLIDINKKLVGLYNDQHSVSHDRIFIGRSVKTMINDGTLSKLTIGDFRKLDVDIPRLSYRVLYEYKVPHETPVIIY